MGGLLLETGAMGIASRKQDSFVMPLWLLAPNASPATPAAWSARERETPTAGSVPLATMIMRALVFLAMFPAMGALQELTLIVWHVQMGSMIMEEHVPDAMGPV